MQKINDSLKIKYEKFTLPNGVKVILYQRNEIHSVNLRVNVNVGSLDEDEKSNGTAHFLEHVTHDGTDRFKTWEKIDDFLNECSGSTNAYTSHDHTQYHGTFPFQYIDEALIFFSQVVLHPLIKDSDVEKERTIILDEKKRYDDSVNYRVYDHMQKIRFNNKATPYSFEIIGTQDSIKGITSDNIRNFYQTHYPPENIEVYVVGNIDIDKTRRLIEKYFYDEIKDNSSKKIDRAFKKAFPDYSSKVISSYQKLDIDQFYLTVTFPCYEFSLTSAEERYKLSFLKSITASSSYFQSILWKRLREELNLVYGVDTFTYDLYSRNIMGIYTSFKKDHLETVLKEIYEGIEKIKRNQITDVVFKAKQKKLLDTQLMQLDDPENILDWIENYENEIEEHGKGITLGEYLEYVQTLKFEDIIRTANDIYDWKKVNIGIISQDQVQEVNNKTNEIWQKLEGSTLPLI